MKRFRFAYLLVALALVVFARPFVSERLLGVAVVDVLLFVTLLAGAFAAIDQRRTFVAVVVLGVVSAATQIGFVLTPSAAASATTSVLYLLGALLFYGSVTWVLLRTLFGHQKRVTHDTLYQAVSVYLLIGIIGAMVYALLELASPGAFRFSDERDREAHFARFLGFSFTTLTTLGYGNIAPATPRADALTTLQAVLGQVYLAIVIARLVAIQISQHDRDGDQDT